MITYPNQKIITVNKSMNSNDTKFLQVSHESWQVACNTLTYSAFKLYLYFVGNKDGYTFALSYEAVNEVLPMSRNTYDKCIAELKQCGYLTHYEGNLWHFVDAI